jgi:hypothetical protein
MKHIPFAAFWLMTAVFAIAQSTTGVQTSNADKATSNADKATSATSEGTLVTPATPLEPAGTGEPHTEMLDTADSPAGHDPLLEPKPLPRANLSLIGGIVRKVDVIHNRLTLQPFGGGNKYVIYFDERSRILSGGRETTVLGIHPGNRVYVDTQALGAQVFARTIQVRTTGGPAQASGQVVELLGGQVRLQDRLSGETIRFVISDRTRVATRSGPASAEELRSGSLIDVTFVPDGRRSEAQSITVYASPGESYVFAGILTHVDIRDGVLALDNQVDGNNYELSFDPLGEKNVGRLVLGTSVTVTASFDGRRYLATSINITERTAGLDSTDR